MGGPVKVNQLMSIIRIKHCLVRLQNILVCQLLVKRFQVSPQGENLVRLGSSYGGWWVPELSDEKLPTGSFLVSAGLGGDVSFDKEMLSRGYICVGLDPLSEAISYSKSELAEFSNFFALNCGLSDVSGKKIFYAPQISEHDSWSINNMHKTDFSLSQSFSVVTISDLERMFPALENAPYRILKMDIEGGEIPVLKQILHSKIKFDYLAIEVDYLSLISFLSIKTRIRHFLTVWKLMVGLEEQGYSLCKTENFNFCWILSRKTPSDGKVNVKH